MASIMAPAHLREVAASRFLDKPRKTLVRWTEDEWKELAQRVHKKRARHPDMTLWHLINAVQKQQDDPNTGQQGWPEDRVRIVNGAEQCRPILKYLTEIDMAMYEYRDRAIPALHDTIETLKRERPDKETLLAQLHPEEIQRRFGQTILDALAPADLINHFKTDMVLSVLPLSEVVAYAMKELVLGVGRMEDKLANHIVEEHNTKTAASNTGHVNGSAKKASSSRRIAVVGFQLHMLPVIKAAVGPNVEVVHVPKNGDNMPVDVDYVLIYEHYCPGQVRQRIIKAYPHNNCVYSGRLDRLSDRLETIQFFREVRKPR